jgi:alpha-amylase/alpha-mannosidase (GH57 family)
MNHSQLYFFHSQPKFGRFSFFDSGKNQPYYDAVKEQALLVKLIDEKFKPWLGSIEKAPKSSVSCAISGKILQVLMEDDVVIKQFRKLIDAGQIELLVSPFYDSLSSLISKDLFVEEIKLQQALLAKVGKNCGQGFLNAATIYSNDLAVILAELDINYVLAPGLSWYLPENSTDTFFKSPDNSLTVALATETNKEDKLNHKINLINGFSDLAEPIHKESISIAKAQAKSKITETYSIEDVVALGTGGNIKLDDYIGNSLQKDFFDRVKKLAPQVIKANKSDCLADFYWLSSSKHLLQISNKEIPPKRYTNFVVLQNILYDLELRLR